MASHVSAWTTGKIASQSKKWLRDLLIEARKAKGLNQTELAAMLGRTQTFVSNYERGERRVGLVDFVLIALALGEVPADLLRRLS